MTSNDVLRGVEQTVLAIRADGQLSADDKTERLDDVVNNGNEALDQVDRAIAAARDHYQSWHARVAEGAVVPDGDGYVEKRKPSAEELPRLSELRIELRTVSPTTVREKYLQAVITGGDPLLVDAIETASSSFPIVPDRVREEARQLRLTNSPLAQSLDKGRQALELRDMHVAHVRRHINGFRPPRQW